MPEKQNNVYSEWDLDQEQEVLKKFRENFEEKDPEFTKWVNCLFTAQKYAQLVPVKERHNKKIAHEDFDVVLFMVGEILSKEPQKEADRLFYLLHRITDFKYEKFEGFKHDLSAMIAYSLDHRPQPE